MVKYIINRGLNPKYYTKKKIKNTLKHLVKNQQTSIFHHHLRRLKKQSTMICCFQTIGFAYHSTSNMSRSHQKSLKEIATRKLTSDLESKVIGSPDSRHKSKKHPSTHDPPKQTPKPV